MLLSFSFDYIFIVLLWRKKNQISRFLNGIKSHFSLLVLCQRVFQRAFIQGESHLPHLVIDLYVREKIQNLFNSPPPSPLDDHKFKENMLLGRSLTKTTPAQFFYPSSVPSRFPAKRLRDLSLTPKKPDILQDDLEASPSSWTRKSCEFRSINLDKRDPFSFSAFDNDDSDTEEFLQTQETERTPERQKQRRLEEV